MLVGCEVDDLIITGNDAACVARFKKKLIGDYNATDWECIASFLGVNMDYDLDSGVLAMDVKSKTEKLFDVSFVSVLCQEAQCRFRWRHPASVWDVIFLLKFFFTHDSRYAPWPSPRPGMSTSLLVGDQ